MEDFEEIMSYVNDIIYYGYFGYDEYGDYGLTGYYNREVKNDYDEQRLFDSELKDSENKAEFIISYSIDFAIKHLDDLKAAVSNRDMDIPDSALIIAGAAEIYKAIHKDLSKSRAYFYADDYAKLESNIIKYGTEKKAWDKGYNRYLEDNVLSVTTCANRVAEVYFNKASTIKR